MSAFEKYAHLYQNLYSLEAWFIWLSLWAQYLGYYLCLLGGFFLLLFLAAAPVFIGLNLIRSVKIKIVSRQKKKKDREKAVRKMKDDYKKALENYTKRVKKKKKHK
jgi:hypothetical protein